MAEYIEREAALAFQNELGPMVCKSIMTDELFSATKDSDLVAFLQNIPSADVVTRDCYDRLLSENDKLRKVRPVVYGEWIRIEPNSGTRFLPTFRCSVCGISEYSQTKFCPTCGADMRKERDNG